MTSDTFLLYKYLIYKRYTSKSLLIFVKERLHKNESPRKMSRRAGSTLYLASQLTSFLVITFAEFVGCLETSTATLPQLVSWNLPMWLSTSCKQTPPKSGHTCSVLRVSAVGRFDCISVIVYREEVFHS